MSNFVNFSPLRAVLTLVVSGIALSVANPEWLRTTGCDVWKLPQLERDVNDADHKARELTVIDGDVQTRIATKEMLVTELIDGRASLADVTDRFAALNDTQPEYMDIIRTTYQGRTDREKVARTVIAYASSRIDGVAEHARLIERLESELTEMNCE